MQIEATMDLDDLTELMGTGSTKLQSVVMRDMLIEKHADQDTESVPHVDWLALVSQANETELDETQLKALDDAHSRYMALIGISPGLGFPDAVLQSDKRKYQRFVLNSEKGVPVECSKDLAEFLSELSGVSVEACLDWQKGVFDCLSDEDQETIDSAYPRYMTLIGCGSWGVPADTALLDQKKYARFIKPFDKSRLVYSDADCAEFAADLTGISASICAALLIGKF